LLARPVQIDTAINHKDTWGTTKYAPPIEQIVSGLVAEKSTKSLETISGFNALSAALLG
jgi:hypothetical protein